MEILIIRLSSMGDVVLATSALEYLKSAFPQSNLWFVTEKKYAGLFAGDTRLARVIPVEKDGERDAAQALFGVVWDKIIDLQHNRRSLRIRKGLVSRQAATVFRKRHFARNALLFARANLYPRGDSVVVRYARAAGYTGAPGAFPGARLLLDDRKCDAALRLLPQSAVVRPAIALFPFSAWKNKEWSAKNFAFVGRYFAIKGWDVLIAGGPQDAAAAAKMKFIVGERCISAAGKLSLTETACLIARCRLALGNDTGLSHIARACGVKTGIIYGPTTSHFGFYPYGDPPYRVFEAAQFCRPCHAHGGNVCLLGSRQCMRKIHPEDVIAGLEDLHSQRKIA
jgi:heptosyltransferase II